jgi:DNA topoisomerase-1
MGTSAQELLKLPKRKMDKVIGDVVKSAEIVNLVYVTDTSPGIVRVKKGKGFQYVLESKKVTDPQILDRIKKLVIPPAWKEVWICTLANGHLQATGLDLLQRKQYRYHHVWNHLRNQTKFYRMQEFGKALPAIRLRLEKDLALPVLCREKVLAAVVCLMERTHIRVGNGLYEKLYGSFGITTLKDKHAVIKGKAMSFSFKGKKGVMHNISIRNAKLAKIVKQCKDIPGKELFQYYDENGQHKDIDSGMVNQYIKEISGSDFTAKDFRTWAGTVQALLAFKELGPGETEAETKQRIVAALDAVSQQLGNTRAVCKKYYVHPVLLSLYEDKSLNDYLNALDRIEKNDGISGLTPEEKIMMKILHDKG